MKARPLSKGTKGGRGIDSGIEREVRVLWENGIETFESRQGGQAAHFLSLTTLVRSSVKILFMETVCLSGHAVSNEKLAFK